MLKAVKEKLLDVYFSLRYFFKTNLNHIGNLVIIATPFISMWLEYVCYQSRGYFAVGSEIAIPLILLLVARVIKINAEMISFGGHIPVPRKRFTIKSKNSYKIQNADLHEMIVYVGTLEDYLESIGKLRS